MLVNHPRGPLGLITVLAQETAQAVTANSVELATSEEGTGGII